MAKIINRSKPIESIEQMVNNSIDKYINDSTSSYANFLESAPVLCNYYSRHAYQSTYDVSLENYNEAVGSESPNKFFRVEKFPLYSLETSNFETQITDDGIAGDVTSSCIILPDSITPMIDDQIELVHQSKKLLFTVTGCPSDNINNKKFYKLSLKLSNYTVDEIKNQISKEMEFDYSMIGKGNTVLTKDNAEILKNIRTIFDAVLDSYTKNFYSKNLSCFIDEDSGIVDQNLNYFISSNELNKSFTQFRNSRIVSNSLLDKVSMKEYRSTVMHMFEALDFSNTGKYVTSFIPVPENARYGFNYFTKKKLDFVEFKEIYSNLPNSKNLNISILSTVLSPEDNVEDDNLLFLNTFKNLVINKYDEENLAKIISQLDNIDDRFYNSESEYKIYASDYYLNAFLLFSLKILYQYFSKT